MQRYPNVKKVVIDSQGGGSAFYDWARGKFGGMLEEIVFRKDKVDMYRLFKIACFQGRVKSYIDRELSEEFLAFTSDMKPTKGNTDDLLDGFVMGAKDWITNNTGLQYQFFGFKRGKKSSTWRPTVRG